MFRLADRTLNDQLGDIQLGIVIIEVENPELVDAGAGLIDVVGVGERQEAVRCDAPPGRFRFCDAPAESADRSRLRENWPEHVLAGMT